MNNISNEHRHPFGSRTLWTLFVLLVLSAFVTAQETGKNVGGYTTHQTIEFGGRVGGDVNGSEAVYNTFVNLHSGARLMDYSLTMHADRNVGTLFNDLSFANTGYGGDPNNISRLRIQKDKWYDFTAQFRRDVNFYDYNAFANPLNYGKTVANPNGVNYVPFNDSVHVFNTRRKMGDFNLVLAPQSPVRVRLGWSRYDNQGPSNSSFHEGTDVQFLQNFSARQDTYTAGVDVKVAPRTTVSYDQIFTHGKNNTWYTDTNVNNGYFVNVGGTLKPVDIGAIYNPYYNQPCAGVAISSTGVVTQSGTAPNGCGVYANYLRTDPSKLNIATEQLSFRSNYFRKLDLTGSATYSASENKIDNYFETMNYWVSRLNEIGAQYTGKTRARRIDAGADFGFTYHISDNWSFSNLTKFQNWRTPGTWNQDAIACYPSVPGNSASFVGPYTPASPNNPACPAITGQPIATTSTVPTSVAVTFGADLTSQLFSRYLGEMSWQNTSLIEWNPSRKFGTHVGYRHKQINASFGDFDGAVSSTYLGAPLTYTASGKTTTRPGNGAVVVSGTASDELEKEEVNEQSLLFGVKVRPVQNWNVSGDLEWTYADNQLTPISPRHLIQTKIRSTYRVAKWASVNTSINVKEGRNSYVPMNPAFDDTGAVTGAFPNGYTQPRHTDHTRIYNVGMTLNPTKSVVLDFGYTLNDFATNGGACLMVSGSATSPLVPEGGNIQRCLTVGNPFNSNSAVGQAIPSILDYAQNTNTGYFNVQLKPMQRVTFNFGADVTADSGHNNWLRADTGALLRVPVDQFGNVIISGAKNSSGVWVPAPATGQVLSGYMAGPNPFQPVGTLAMSWIKPTAGVEVELSKALTFKGQYNYYGYNEHGGWQNNSRNGMALRDFDTSTGTVSLKYSF